MSEKTTILYTSCLCSREMEQKLFAADPRSLGLQIQKYHRLLARGFRENGAEVLALSYQKGIEQLGIPDRMEESEDGVDYIYLTNPGGSYLRLLWNSFSAADRFLEQHNSAFMVCDVLNFTVSLGAALAARRRHRQVLGIITDFPEQLFEKNSIFCRLIWWLVRLCTGYIVLTEQMKERLDPAKPAIVLEGHVDSRAEQIENCLEEKYDKKVCLYAGMLHRKYGIEKLVKAFAAAGIPDAELHIYGDGDYAEELKKNRNPSIRYFGIVPNAQVVAEECKATLLINPRPTDEEFTKYSFPSKNLEYMVSGTPLLTTRLPGMPAEYADYVYLFDDESVEGMSETLRSVLSPSREALFEKGKRARAFVLENKTETVQAGKILRFF